MGFGELAFREAHSRVPVLVGAWFGTFRSPRYSETAMSRGRDYAVSVGEGVRPRKNGLWGSISPYHTSPRPLSLAS